MYSHKPKNRKSQNKLGMKCWTGEEIFSSVYHWLYDRELETDKIRLPEGVDSDAGDTESNRLRDP